MKHNINCNEIQYIVQLTNGSGGADDAHVPGSEENLTEMHKGNLHLFVSPGCFMIPSAY